MVAPDHSERRGRSGSFPVRSDYSAESIARFTGRVERPQRVGNYAVDFPRRLGPVFNTEGYQAIVVVSRHGAGDANCVAVGEDLAGCDLHGQTVLGSRGHPDHRRAE